MLISPASEARDDTGPAGSVSADAELALGDIKARVLSYSLPRPSSGSRMFEDRFWVELGLSPWHRSARASFPGHWKPSRLERVGSLFLIPPGFEAKFTTDECEPIRSVAVEFAAERVYAMIEAQVELRDWQLVAALDVQSSRIRALLVRLAEEISAPGFASSIILESVVTQMAVELVRHGDALSNTVARGGLSAWQLRVINERLAELGRAPSLTELAALCRVSVRQLQRSFLASSGVSIGSHVVHNRIEQSKLLLASGCGLAEIAQVLGFSSASNFSFAFRRELRMTPGQYRQSFLKH